MKVMVPRYPILNEAAITRAIENTLTMAARGVKVDFDVTTRTWQDRPDFETEKSPGRRVIFTTNKVYGYLNRGTRVRHALMVPDFRPKTRHRYIGSNKGRGGVIIVSRKIVRPGIEAREFDTAIGEKWTKELPGQLQRALTVEVQRQNSRNSTATE